MGKLGKDALEVIDAAAKMRAELTIVPPPEFSTESAPDNAIPPIVAPVAIEPAPVVDTPAEPDYRQLFKTTEGRLKKAEKERAKMEQQYETLLDEIARLKEVVTAPPVAPVAEPAITSSYIVENYGEEMQKAITDLVKGLITQELGSAMGAVHSEVGAVKQSMHMSAIDAYNRELTKVIPDWKELGTSDEFSAWLSATMESPYSTISLYDRLNAANKAMDVKTVLAIINTYKAQATTMAPVVQPSVDAYLAPPQGAPTPQQTAAPAKRVYKQDEIDTFNRDVALGKWRGRDTEIRAWRMEFFKAAQEGRIKA